ncbi:PREDICTED: telomeric repeat-binding factor 1 [Tinamus guttatus]|uniref:telomeric repeat-binding factor 1 n=1 Tax=Tinamus guttatus TaxID=94827 RepID=UPI00052F3EB4|nr:PREDICTED: telomeric repeat-binding factor 1 [Tinamus guttatus]
MPLILHSLRGIYLTKGLILVTSGKPDDSLGKRPPHAANAHTNRPPNGRTAHAPSPHNTTTPPTPTVGPTHTAFRGRGFDDVTSRVPLSAAGLAQAEALVGDWVLEFACYCLCRPFREDRAAEFRRFRDVAQAVINNLSKIATHQKKTVYVCQLLTRIAKGKRLDCHFENDESISPLESALSVWTLLEREESKLDKLHEDIRRLIQIQVVAVHMEKGYFKEAAAVLERLFTDLESNKSLKMKLATIIKSKDPYVPFLQNFSYDLMIRKIKNYVELFMKDNEANFLIQAAMKQVEAKELGGTILDNETGNVSATNEEINLEASQRFVFGSVMLKDSLVLRIG